MSATAGHAEEQTNPASRLGFEPGQVVQELGYDDDVDHELREGIEGITGEELADEEYDDVADGVILWFRDDDGDLTDALVDATSAIDEGAQIWLMTPKTGRDGHVEPSDIGEAAQTMRPGSDQQCQRLQGLDRQSSGDSQDGEGRQALNPGDRHRAPVTERRGGASLGVPVAVRD